MRVTLLLVLSSLSVHLPGRSFATGDAGDAPVRAAATAGERQLEGKWLIIKMVRGGKAVERPDDVKMTMSFRTKDHTWLFTIETKEQSFSEAGRWKLDGSRLVTTSDDGNKVERMRVRSIGEGVLELKKTDERLVLRRQATQ